MAPGVDLYALKVIAADGTGYESDLIAALQWAIDHRIQVVNMSVGTHTVVPELQAMVEQAYAAGVTMVAAAGNVNPTDIWELIYGCPVVYPAAYPQVIATTFTNELDQLTGYSCTGPQVDVTAPGDQIVSPVPVSCPVPLGICSETGYNWLSGSSMASPHVAGLAALILSAGITDSGDLGTLADDVRAHIRATTRQANMSLADSRYPNWYGAGLIDAGKALIDQPPPGAGPQNRAPVATDDVASTSEDTPTVVNVLANDTDPDNDALTVSAFGQAAHGSVTSVTGGLRYTPAANWNGNDSFTYTASDGRATDTATVTVAVSRVNDPPVAVDDAATTPQATQVVIDVLANDSDVDGDTLSIGSFGQGANGTVAVATGGLRYTPNGSWTGTDTFTYLVSDGVATDTGRVTITVTATPHAPVAVDDVAATTEDTPVLVAVLANDSDPDGDSLSLVSVQNAVLGVATRNPDGTVTFTPDANASGAASFAYTITDGSSTASASVAISVAPVNDVPTATDRTASTTAPASVQITLQGTDLETCDLTFTIVALPARGGVGSLTDQGCVAGTGGAANTDTAKVTYTPAAGSSGIDSFSYRVGDGTASSAAATVTVTVAPDASTSTVHVGDLDGTSAVTNKTWRATVTIRVDNGAHAAVAGATITGSWSGAATGTSSCTTSATGVCTLTQSNLPRSRATITFTVTGIVSAGATYVSSANHDPDGSSNGTVITIRR